ncbi:MAG: hypothetical protein AAF570_21335, partial [Bacteroidota bacterium]
ALMGFGLVLLGMIHTKTGDELPLEDIGMPMVKRYDGIEDLAAIREIQEENREGFVIRFEDGLRVKVKFEEYVRLHRIIAGITARVIWEYMKEGAAMEALLEQVPDEFYKWVKAVQADLRSEYNAIDELCQKEHKSFETRKEAAEYFLAETTYPAIQFKMLDGRPYDEIIWKLIYPEHATPFMQEEG